MLEGGPQPTGSSSPAEPLGNRQEGSGTEFLKLPTRQKRTNSKQLEVSMNSQSPLTQGSSREGCLLPQREPSQATVVLGGAKAATHSLTNK